MENVSLWHVALSLTFVVSFLMMIAVAVWRNTVVVAMGQSVRVAAASIPSVSSGSRSRKREMWGDQNSIADGVLRVDAGSARPEIGSWVIATTAFLLIAFRQTDVV